jgi:hypothetical protein
VLTSFNNSYELQVAGRSIPGFYPLDGVKIAGRNLVALAPFFIGARVLCTSYGRLLLLKSLVAATLIYSLPMLFEIRMSPQLHTWIYGYFPNDTFSQQIRGSSYRPVVFTEHGLALALFTSLALIAAIILHRLRIRVFNIPPLGTAAYLSALLLLCRSLGPIIYAVILLPVTLFTGPRVWTKIACAVTIVVCFYPALRSNGLAPTQIVSQFASAVSPQRAASFETRTSNEEQLLAKALEKPFFGWGAWGRNRIFDEWTGRDVSVTDGGWVINLGIYGWFGYLSLFGLLAAATFRANRVISAEASIDDIAIGALALLLAVYVADQIPNANPLSFTFLLAGSLAAASATRASSPFKLGVVSRRPSRPQSSRAIEPTL